MIGLQYRMTLIILVLILVQGCKNDDDNSNPPPASMDSNKELPEIDQRSFKMGFSTWSYGPTFENREDTYNFISANSDIYTEQIDDKIPWEALINNQTLPQEFINEVDGRVQRKLSGQQLVLYVGLLNLDRDDLLEDYDGSIPAYDSLNEKKIEDAYFKHLDYLITEFNPNYLVASVESNELLLVSEKKWDEYKKLMSQVRIRLEAKYPTLSVSESVTLHNWYKVDVPDPNAFEEEIADYVNQLDFVSVSFYPFFKGLKTKENFQDAFDFLHQQVSKPIAFIETCHLAENLNVSGLNLSISSDPNEQKAYLASLFTQAHENNYLFIIWWAHRDYDRLWETFPEEVKDIGQLWRDTGVLDEDGNERPSFLLWKSILNR